jgi:hypothetical protein
MSQKIEIFVATAVRTLNLIALRIVFSKRGVGFYVISLLTPSDAATGE